MRATRKTLQAQNTQFRAQLAVHDNISRATLNECVQKTRAINKQLEADKALLESKLAETAKQLDEANSKIRVMEKKAA